MEGPLPVHRGERCPVGTVQQLWILDIQLRTHLGRERGRVTGERVSSKPWRMVTNMQTWASPVASPCTLMHGEVGRGTVPS